MRHLIINADDFGNSIPINEAVEEGYNAGILSSASLMVAGDAYDDAVRRSLKLKKLGIGLHLTLLDGTPVLSRKLLPNLVSNNGKFFNDPINLGIRLYYSPIMQKQAEMEIEAQFQKFHKLGLILDHVNSHKHFHMHPSIVKILGKILPKYGKPPVRIPFEPFLKRHDIDFLNSIGRFLKSIFFNIQCRPLKKELKKLGILTNQYVFGHFDSGNMDANNFIYFINNLPLGTTEIYCHPATNSSDGQNNLPRNYKFLLERNALQSISVKNALINNNLIPTTYNALKSNFV